MIVSVIGMFRQLRIAHPQVGLAKSLSEIWGIPSLTGSPKLPRLRLTSWTSERASPSE
jgi:hypothetical protein